MVNVRKPTNFCAVRPSVAFGSTARRLPGWRADCPPGREIGFRPTTSGLPLETDIVRAGRHVSKEPNSEVAFSFDHLVRAEEERGGNLNAQGPRCRRIDD